MAASDDPLPSPDDPDYFIRKRARVNDIQRAELVATQRVTADLNVKHSQALEAARAEHEKALADTRDAHTQELKQQTEEYDTWKSQLETQFEQSKNAAEAGHQSQLKTAQAAYTRKLQEQNDAHSNELRVKEHNCNITLGQYEAIWVRARDALEFHHRVTLNQLEDDYTGALASTRDDVQAEFAQQHDWKVDEAQRRANEVIASTNSTLQHQQELLDEHGKTITQYANQQIQHASKVRKLEANLRQVTETKNSLQEAVDLENLRSTALEHRLNEVQIALKADTAQLSRRNQELSNQMDQLKRQHSREISQSNAEKNRLQAHNQCVEQESVRINNLTEQTKTQLTELFEKCQADNECTSAAKDELAGQVTFMEEQIKTHAAELEVLDMYYQRELRIADSIEADLRDAIAASRSDNQIQSELQAHEAFEMGLAEGWKRGERERTRLNANLDALRRPAPALEDDSVQSQSDGHSLQGMADECSGIHEPESNSTEIDMEEDGISYFPSHSPLFYEHNAIDDSLSTAPELPAFSSSSSLPTPFEPLIDFDDQDSRNELMDLDVNEDPNLHSDLSRQDVTPDDESASTTILPEQVLPDSPQDSGDPQDDRPLPFGVFKVFLGTYQQNGQRNFVSPDELSLPVLTKLKGQVYEEWLREAQKHPRWSDDITIEEALEKTHAARGCVDPILRNQGTGAKWTQEDPAYLSCKRCANMTRICIKSHAGTHVMLPLHPKLRTSTDFHDLGF